MFDFTITIKGKSETLRDAHYLARDIQTNIERYQVEAKVGLKVEDKPPIEQEQQ